MNELGSQKDKVAVVFGSMMMMRDAMDGWLGKETSRSRTPRKSDPPLLAVSLLNVTETVACMVEGFGRVIKYADPDTGKLKEVDCDEGSGPNGNWQAGPAHPLSQYCPEKFIESWQSPDKEISCRRYVSGGRGSEEEGWSRNATQEPLHESKSSEAYSERVMQSRQLQVPFKLTFTSVYVPNVLMRSGLSRNEMLPEFNC